MEIQKPSFLMDIVIFFQTPNALIVPVSSLRVSLVAPYFPEGCTIRGPIVSTLPCEEDHHHCLKNQFQAKYEAMQMVFGRPS